MLESTRGRLGAVIASVVFLQSLRHSMVSSCEVSVTYLELSVERDPVLAAEAWSQLALQARAVPEHPCTRYHSHTTLLLLCLGVALEAGIVPGFRLPWMPGCTCRVCIGAACCHIDTTAIPEKSGQPRSTVLSVCGMCSLG